VQSSTWRHNVATEPKEKTNSYSFNSDERKLLIKALAKLDASTSRFLTTAQKEEDDKSVASAKETLAALASIKAKF